MKFQIDLEEKKILFTEPFTKHDLEKVLNLLNIDDVEEWKVDMYNDYKPNPLLPPTDNTGWWQNPYDNTGWWQNPYIITSTATESINFTNNSSTTELETIYN
jgi:hypothetical protein